MQVELPNDLKEQLKELLGGFRGQAVLSSLAVHRSEESPEDYSFRVANATIAQMLEERLDDVKQLAQQYYIGLESLRVEIGESLTVQEAEEQIRRSLANQRQISQPTLGYAVPTPPALDDRYTFDSYVVYAEIQAVSIAKAIAQNPGCMGIPMTVIGPSGSGKTHVSQAVAHVVAQDPRKNVVYAQCETYVNQLYEAFGTTGAVPRIQSRYRDVDLLVLENLEYIGTLRKPDAFLKELIGTIVAVTQRAANGKPPGQVVLTTQVPPTKLKLGSDEELNDRLRKLLQGVLIELKPPKSLDDCLEIARRKTDLQGVQLSDEVLRTVVSLVEQSPTVITGAVSTLCALAKSDNAPAITVELAISLLAHYTKNKTAGLVGISTILECVELVYKSRRHREVTAGSIVGPERTRYIVEARHFAVYIAWERSFASGLTDADKYRELGKIFGGRDRATLINSLRKAEVMRGDEVAAQIYEDILVAIQARD